MLPSYVKHKEWPYPPHAFSTFFDYPSTYIISLIGFGSFFFLPVPVWPYKAYPQQYKLPVQSIAKEWYAPHAILWIGTFFNILYSFFESYLKKWGTYWGDEIVYVVGKSPNWP